MRDVWAEHRARIEKYYDDPFYHSLARARGWSRKQTIAAAVKRRKRAHAQGVDRKELLRSGLDNPFMAPDAWQYMINCTHLWHDQRCKPIKSKHICAACGQAVKA